MKRGFTLVELSIVLVIIGLIVGGVLVGRDLIAAAQVRATVSQIEKYQTAAQTFRLKYGYLPGDIPEPAASSVGLQARGSAVGAGDGNGIFLGSGGGGIYYNNGEAAGESPMFWKDLSATNLIDGQFTAASPTSDIVYADANTSPALKNIFPTAKLSDNVYFYVWSFGSANYLTLASISNMGTVSRGLISATSGGITAAQAYGIDSKIDDGLPMSGKLLARHFAYNISTCCGYAYWSNGNISYAPYSTTTVPGPTTCFDNNSQGATTQQYSLGYNGGAGQNCGLTLAPGF